jgi:hypothetical protein
LVKNALINNTNIVQLKYSTKMINFNLNTLSKVQANVNCPRCIGKLSNGDNNNF